jgi:MFS transporter, DHA1 family, multidrug resistance protein
MLVAISALTLMGPLSSDAVLPALPTIAADFGARADTVQLTISGALVGVAVGHLLVGMLTDALGRRALLLAGTAVMTVSTVIAAFTPTVDLLVIASTLTGLGSSAGLVLGRAVVADVADGPPLLRT